MTAPSSDVEQDQELPKLISPPANAALPKPGLADAAALTIVSALPFFLYWRASLGQGMFYFGDIARFFYPTRLLYAEALRNGRLPLWQPEILGGIPLFAEMQTGMLYPLHLALYRLLPIDWALNYDILLHLAWLAAGMYLFARARRISIVGAMLAAMMLSLGGFGAARITHPNVLSVASWLPWLLWLFEKWRVSSRLLYWVLLTLAFALQWLGGHPQFALINCLTFAVYVIAISWLERDRKQNASARGSGWSYLRSAAIPLGALALGGLIAAAQLLPTFEFSQQSARTGGVDEAFFTQFSYNPLYLLLLVAPFLRGNPYPNTSVEVIAYVGLVPLVFAAVAVLFQRERMTWFWVAVAVGALLLAFGGNTPLYRALRYLPLFNLFRVPARFLLPFALSVAILAGIGFDTLWARTRAGGWSRREWVVAAVIGGAVVLLMTMSSLVPVETWVDVWRFLPILFGALALLLVLRATRLKRVTFAILAVGLTLIDLLAFSAVYLETYNVIAPRAEVFPKPRVLDFLDLKDGSRVLTSTWIIPWISVMNESLYENLNAAYAVNAAHGYTPLEPERTQEFLDELSPAMLSLFGIKYYLIPQQLPLDATTEGADVKNPFIADPLVAPLEFSEIDANGIEVESSLAQSANLKTGDVVAEIILTDATGRDYNVPLRAGEDTAEWAYDRSDVRRSIQHTQPEIASTFPARSAFPIEDHPGHTYRAQLKFADAAVPITSIRAEPKIDAGLIHIQNLALLDGDTRVDVAPLVGKGQQSLIYRSEDVAVYDNRGVTPRAFITHTAYKADDAEALARLRSPNYNGELLLADGEEMPSDLGQGFFERAEIVSYEPEHVVVDLKADFDGYLVLTDAWDPNWQATLDGVPTPIERADVILRAVRVGTGEHRVEFFYRPRSFFIGLLISGIAVAVLGVVVLGVILWRLRSQGNVLQPTVHQQAVHPQADI